MLTLHLFRLTVLGLLERRRSGNIEDGLKSAVHRVLHSDSDGRRLTQKQAAGEYGVPLRTLQRAVSRAR